MIKRSFFLTITPILLTLTTLTSQLPYPEIHSLKNLCLDTISQNSAEPCIKNKLKVLPNGLLRLISKKCPHLSFEILQTIAKRSPVEPEDALSIAIIFPQYMWKLLYTHDFDDAFAQTFPPNILGNGNEAIIKKALRYHMPRPCLNFYMHFEKTTNRFSQKYVEKVLSRQKRYRAKVDLEKSKLLIQDTQTDIICHAISFPINLGWIFNESTDIQYALISSDKNIIAIITTANHLEKKPDIIFLFHTSNIQPHISLGCESLKSCAFSSNNQLIIQTNKLEHYFLEIPHDFLSNNIPLQGMIHTIMRGKLEMNHASAGIEKLIEKQKRLSIAKKILHNKHAIWHAMNRYEINRFIEHVKGYQEDFLLDNGASTKKRYPYATPACPEKIKQLLPATLAHLPNECKLSLLYQADERLHNKSIKLIMLNMEKFIATLQHAEYSDEMIRTELRTMLRKAIDTYIEQS